MRETSAADRALAFCTVSDVAERYGVPTIKLFGKRGSRDMAVARHEAIRAVADALPHWSSVDIGTYFRRDHTTVLYALGRLSRTKTTLREAYHRRKAASAARMAAIYRAFGQGHDWSAFE